MGIRENYIHNNVFSKSCICFVIVMFPEISSCDSCRKHVDLYLVRNGQVSDVSVYGLLDRG